MTDQPIKSKPTKKGNLIAGTLLLILGIVFLVGQVFDIHLGTYVWPFLVIVPGVILFLLALMVDEEMGQALAILGAIVTMVGVILLVQNITGFWTIWSYAWALVAPTAAGLGLWLFGTFKERPNLVKSGKDLTRIGLIIFVIAAVFFEFVIGVNGHNLGRYGLPLVLIILGIFLLVRNVRHSWRKT